MTQNMDFEKYQYFFNGWVARKDKETGETERFIDGKWVIYEFSRDIQLMAHVGDEDVIELDSSDASFLEKQLKLIKAKGTVEQKCHFLK
jgi:hypothetical protein